jgi:cytochrome P450 family 9
VVSVAALALTYWLLVRPHKYWQRKGVNQKDIIVPIFGDNWGTILHKQSIAEMVQEAYKTFPNSRQENVFLDCALMCSFFI